LAQQSRLFPGIFEGVRPITDAAPKTFVPSPDSNRMGTYEARLPRKRAFLNGVLVRGDGAFTFACTIRDISDGGAKVTLEKRQLLPADLYLIVVKFGVAHRVKVVWADYPARGLQFGTTYLLNATPPKELTFLRQLWLDLYARSGGAPVAEQWDVERIRALCGSV
jgi:PilZ domain